MLKLSDLNLDKLLLEEPENEQLPAPAEIRPRDIAIIGLSLRAPMADSAAAFWQNIRDGVGSTRGFPEQRRRFADRFLDHLGKPQERTYSAGGYLEGIEQFDAKFFKMLPTEASLMSPDQRLFLECAWEALEEAGYSGARAVGTRTGVYVGYVGDLAGYNYRQLIDELEVDPLLRPASVPGNLSGIVASRISYLLDLKGPAMLIDTACSSSLVAVHQACAAIRNGDCEMALAGGVRLNLIPLEQEAAKVGIDSSDGKTRAFDNSADGTAMGEGVGCVLLKPLAQAVQDGDPVYAVIKGSAVNQDGLSAGITFPNAQAQTDVLARAWKDANLDPATLSYLEAHGTGTKIGDPIELDGLTRAFARFTDRKQFVAIGSLKSNIGHAYQTAGLLGLIKAALALHHRELPPTLHVREPNRQIKFVETPFYVNTRRRAWPAGETPRRCGVSSFGFSGTNAHVVLEEAPLREKAPERRAPHLLALSAMTPESLRNLVRRYVEFLPTAQGTWEEICFSAGLGRAHFSHRVAVVAHDAEEAVSQLKHWLERAAHPRETDVSDATGSARSAGDAELLHDIADAYLRGENVEFDRLFARRRLSYVHLPTYPFDRVRCWVEVPETSRPAATREVAAASESRAPVASAPILLSGREDQNYTPMERQLADVCQRVLGLREINIQDSFFEMGGNSILLQMVYNRLQELFPGQVRMADLFAHSSIMRLAQRLTPAVAASSPAVKTTEPLAADDLQHEDIAIIGVAADLPGADSLAAFYTNLRTGVDAVRTFPEARRADIDRYLRWIGKPDAQMKYMEGAFLPRIDEFDPHFFRLSPREASLMDPSQRLFLQTAWHCLEDAGYGGERLSGSQTGVYVGFAHNVKDSYQKMILDVDPAQVSLSITANLAALLPTRLSYLLDLKGPTMVVDTACSASLVALHQACLGIRHGDCEQALVGSVKLHTVPLDDPNYRIGMESSDHRTRAFHDKSDGTGIGEASIAVLIKPLRAALRDNDQIYAVIKGSAINQDGKSLGITAPNPQAQTEVLQKAWKAANVHPETLSYIETHGTGTKMGDPVEIEGLKDAFAPFTQRKQVCGLGSVKPNIGHLYEAAGLASVVKAVLMFKHRELLPTMHVQRPNSYIDFVDSPFYLNTKLQPWNSPAGTPRRLGISSFGFSGTNCHLVLEEPPEREKANPAAGGFSLASESYVLPLSAKSLEALENLVAAYAEFFERGEELSLRDICWTAQTGRGHYEYRLALVVADRTQAAKTLRRLQAQGLRLPLKGVFFQGTMPAAEPGDALETLCTQYVAGADIQWHTFYEGTRPAKVSLPLYPFQKKRCWLDIPDRAPAAASPLAPAAQPSVPCQLSGRASGTYTDSEQLIAQVWCQALGIPDLNIQDNFYDLGGDSVIGIRIINRLNERLGLQVETSEFLKYLTIESFAKYLDSLR
jgi:acyl transferase domain-containing protein